MLPILDRRASIVAEARSWEGTRWHHMGRVKIRRNERGLIVEPGGVDCVMLVYMTYTALGIIPEFEVEPYPEQWFLHSDVDRLLPILRDYGHEVETPQPGDVVAYRMGRSFGHAAVVMDTGWPNILHAHRMAGRVLRDVGNAGFLSRRQRKFFSII